MSPSDVQSNKGRFSLKKKTILKRSSLTKKIALVTSGVILLTVAVIFIFRGVQINGNAPNPTETDPSANPENPTKGMLLDKETNNESQYSFELLRYDEIESELLKKWMDNSLAGETTDDGEPVYYALYNNSSANLDIYLFMPAAEQLIGDVLLSNIRITEANTALIIYIDTDDSTTHTRESKDLILHIQAISDMATAKNERLIINGTTYACANTTFTALP